jgi:hypothetical protein
MAPIGNTSLIIIKGVKVAKPKDERGTHIPGVVLNSLFKVLTTVRGFKNTRALISDTVLITILLPSPGRPKLLVANRLSVIIRCNPCCKGGGE